MRKKIEVNVRIRIKSNQSIVKIIDRSIDGGVTVVFFDVNAKPTNQEVRRRIDGTQINPLMCIDSHQNSTHYNL